MGIFQTVADTKSALEYAPNCSSRWNVSSSGTGSASRLRRRGDHRGRRAVGSLRHQRSADGQLGASDFFPSGHGRRELHAARAQDRDQPGPALLAEAESQPVPAGGLPIAFGIASGDVQRTKDDTGHLTNSGSAIDRAQLLANQARAGEVVLDVESREAASRTYLVRALGEHELVRLARRGDRPQPPASWRNAGRPSACSSPSPVPASIRHALEPLKKAAASSQNIRLSILMGPLGIGAASRGLSPSATSSVRPLSSKSAPCPGGLEPLGRTAPRAAEVRGGPSNRHARLSSSPNPASRMRSRRSPAPHHRRVRRLIHALKATCRALQSRPGHSMDLHRPPVGRGPRHVGGHWRDTVGRHRRCHALHPNH